MNAKAVLLLAKARRLAVTGEGRRIRMAHNLSLSEVAAAIGVAPSTLSRYETGGRVPRGGAAAAWAQLLSDLEEQAHVPA